MTTSDVKVSEGTGKNIATWSITEDAEIKQLQRVGLTDSTGAEIVPATAAAQATALTQQTAINTVLGTKADTVWDGAAASPSAHSLWHYLATKLEAVRALLAGTLTVASHAVTNAGTFAVQATPVDPFSQYETVAASSATQAMGATGAAGDYLAGVLVFPGAAGCGVVTIFDNAVQVGQFAGGGTTPLPSLVPFLIPIGLFSVSGAWKITTGANVTAVGIGKFT